jgi:hypothetical protein
LPSIQAWEDDEKLNIFKPLYVYKCKKHKELGEDYKDDPINIVIFPSQDGTFEQHIVYLKEYEKALRISVYPKCKYYVFHKNPDGIPSGNYYRHLKQCTGKKPSKELQVWDNEFPYNPGMFKNSTYIYLLGNDEMNIIIIIK